MKHQGLLVVHARILLATQLGVHRSQVPHQDALSTAVPELPPDIHRQLQGQRKPVEASDQLSKVRIASHVHAPL